MRLISGGSSMRRRLFAGVLFTSVVALLLSGGGLFVYDLHAHRSGSAADLGLQAEMIGYATAAALEFDDRAVATQQLAFLKARPQVRAATITDSRGRRFASYVREDLDDGALPPSDAVDGNDIEGDRVRVVRPVIGDGLRRLGTVRIEADLRMGRRVASYGAIALVVMLSALGVAVLLSRRLQSQITSPIVEMADLARQVVATRDYSVRARRAGDDETAALADAFNEMLTEIESRTASLEASRDEIASLNAGLESRVRHRTAQLEESNLRLRAADVAKSRFLSMMSHEIRTPMNGVLGMLELLALTRLDVQQRSTLEVVRESGRSLLRIIDDILDFSKIEAGKLEVIPHVASVAAVISGVVGIYAGNASSKALTLKSYTDPRISPAVLVDATRLQQILNNLVSNAIKFTAEGFVELRAELIERVGDRERIRFCVIDTGIGIAPQIQAKLFQPFSQADGEVARVFGGTGLGLSIGQRLAAMMDGVITMNSTPGAGTTMALELTLPVADPTALAGGSARPRLPLGDLGRRAPPSADDAHRDGTLVLVVDDHPINRLVLVRQVTLLGYACESANDGREAFEKWSSGRFRTVITDCNMPHMDGYQLARAIRDAERKDARPWTLIIACTANALRGEAENCFAAGMDDYIAKPLEIGALMAKLDYWLPIGAEPAGAQDEPSAPANAVETALAAPLDQSVLEEVCAGDASMLREALRQFQQANARDLQSLLQAFEQRDMAQVQHLSHRMKGSGATLGARSLARVCAEIEKAARSGNWEAILSHRDAFQREVARLNAQLATLAQAG